MAPVGARVIVLAGPSGAGKSRLAERLGHPVLRLDDFYRSGADPLLPRITQGANAGLVDWDDPRSWLGEEALATIEQLCAEGRADVPVYDIAHDGRTGVRELVLGDATLLVAEGIFAQEIVAECRAAGLLDSAWCIRQHPAVTAARRFARDLRERRKPPLVLARRGLALLRDQSRVVEHAVELGCTPATGDEAYAAIRARQVPVRAPASWPLVEGLHQPNETTCGPTVLVVARMLMSPSYAVRLADPQSFEAAVLALHRRTNRPLGPGGRLQLPWPRWLGTPPWAVAAELTTLTPSACYRTWPARFPAQRRRACAVAVAAVRAGQPVALYVGSSALPRHVVLLSAADAGRISLYDPASGRRTLVPDADVAAGWLPELSGWSVAWCVVAPSPTA